MINLGWPSHGISWCLYINIYDVSFKWVLGNFTDPLNKFALDAESCHNHVISRSGQQSSFSSDCLGFLLIFMGGKTQGGHRWICPFGETHLTYEILTHILCWFSWKSRGGVPRWDPKVQGRVGYRGTLGVGILKDGKQSMKVRMLNGIYGKNMI